MHMYLVHQVYCADVSIAQFKPRSTSNDGADEEKAEVPAVHVNFGGVRWNPITKMMEKTGTLHCPS